MDKDEIDKTETLEGLEKDFSKASTSDEKEEVQKEFSKASTSDEKEEVQERIIKPCIYQSENPSDLVKYNYLLNFKRWPIFDFLEPDFIVKIHMAMILKDEGILIVTRDKMVYAFGNNKNKLLGIGNDKFTLKLTKIEGISGKNIKKFVSWEGKARIYALTEEGEVYHWGYDEEELQKSPAFLNDMYEVYKGLAIPTRMKSLNAKHIEDIKCSVTHCLALTNNGDVYMWGYSNFNYTSNNVEPETYFSTDITQIHFDGEKIICIACGNSFSMAVSDQHKVYSWGESNENGVMGVDVRYHSSDTYLVTNISQKKIVEVICGTLHTVARSKKGKLYIWGSNTHGQLGIDQVVMAYLYPILMNKPKEVDHIAIGQNYKRNVAVCKDRSVYVWGEYDTALYFGQDDWAATITSFSNMNEALLSCDKPLMIFADDLKYMDGEMDVLNCWETLFDDKNSSDLKIQIEDQFIYVHEAILKKRSSYFEKLLQNKDDLNIKKDDLNIKVEKQENGKSVNILIQHSKYSYIVYKAYLKYLYTEVIDLQMGKLPDLLELANEFEEMKLKKRCSTKLKMGSQDKM